MLENLPVELVIKILEHHLSVHDLLLCTQLSKLFQQIIQECDALQYKIELEASGMENNTYSTLTSAIKRSLLHQYVQAWSYLDSSKLTQTIISKTHLNEYVEASSYRMRAGVIFELTLAGGIEATQLPSRYRNIARRSWTANIRQGIDPRLVRVTAVDPPSDLAAMCYLSEDRLYLVLRTLSSGQPHSIYPERILIEDDIRYSAANVIVRMFRSRVAIMYTEFGMGVQKLVVFELPSLAVILGHKGQAVPIATPPWSPILRSKKTNTYYTNVEFLDNHNLAASGCSVEPGEETEYPTFVDVLTLPQAPPSPIIPIQTLSSTPNDSYGVLSLERLPRARFQLPYSSKALTCSLSLPISNVSGMGYGGAGGGPIPPFYTSRYHSLLYMTANGRFHGQDGSDPQRLSMVIPVGKLLGHPQVRRHQIWQDSRDANSNTNDNGFAEIPWSEWGPARCRIYSGDREMIQEQISGSKVVWCHDEDMYNIEIHDFAPAPQRVVGSHAPSESRKFISASRQSSQELKHNPHGLPKTYLPYTICQTNIPVSSASEMALSDDSLLMYTDSDVQAKDANQPAVWTWSI